MVARQNGYTRPSNRDKNYGLYGCFVVDIITDQWNYNYTAMFFSSGGSGGGNGASGGQGTNQAVVGAPPDYGNLYIPKEYGGNGGVGGGSSLDVGCTPNEQHLGGKGGGIVQIDVTTQFVLDGQIRCLGSPGAGPKGGGGAGGSIFIKTGELSGTGLLSVQGGSVASGTNVCTGGGGGGGRIAVHYVNNSFIGETHSHGGSGGTECGGAGTVLLKNTLTQADVLRVDNKDMCTPLDSNIAFDILSDDRRGEHSCHTWLYDPTGIHIHNFSEIHLGGQSQLALHRRNIDTFTQYINIYKTSGDKSGMFHVGENQELFADLPTDSPELEFGLRI